MYAIYYGNIYHQYTPFMLAYVPYMDPMRYLQKSWNHTPDGSVRLRPATSSRSSSSSSSTAGGSRVRASKVSSSASSNSSSSARAQRRIRQDSGTFRSPDVGKGWDFGTGKSEEVQEMWHGWHGLTLATWYSRKSLSPEDRLAGFSTHPTNVSHLKESSQVLKNHVYIYIYC